MVTVTWDWRPLCRADITPLAADGTNDGENATLVVHAWGMGARGARHRRSDKEKVHSLHGCCAGMKLHMKLSAHATQALSADGHGDNPLTPLGHARTGERRTAGDAKMLLTACQVECTNARWMLNARGAHIEPCMEPTKV